MMRFCILVAFLLAAAVPAQSQYLPGEDEEEEMQEEEKKGFNPDDMYFGGGLGLQFGSVTFIDISPLAGYWFSDRFTAGIGGQYMHYSVRNMGFSTDIYGGRVFSRYIITDQIFAHAELETLNGQWDHMRDERFNIHHPLVGGGYMTRFGGSGFGAFMILWNLNDSRYSPYTNPVFRINFGFGIF